jgi:autotransporter-associated beta strand protein
MQGFAMTSGFTFVGTNDLDLSGIDTGFTQAAGSTRTITVTANTLTMNGITTTGNFTNGTAKVDGSLAKAGVGTLVIAGASDYTGTTTVSAGTLVAANSAALGSTAAGTSVAAGGTLGLSGGINVGAEALSLTADATANSAVLDSLSGNNTWGGNITVDTGTGTGRAVISSEAVSNLLVTGNVNLSAGTNDFVLRGDGNGEISGQITGTQRLFKSSVGAGTWILSGNNALTFTGKTLVGNGALQISSEANLGATPGAYVADQLQLGGNAANGALNTTATMSLGANRGVTLGANGGTFNTASATTLTVNSVITGNGSLTKTGTGNLAFSATNTYTGVTTVSSGTLVLAATGSIGNSTKIRVQSGATFDASAVTGGFQLQSGQTLQNKGTFIGSLTALAGSTYAPGNSPGLPEQVGDLALNTASTFEWELVANSTALPGVNYDQTQFTSGGLTIQSGVIATLVFDFAGSTVNWNDVFWDTNQQWTLFSGASSHSTVAGIFGTTNIGLDSLGQNFSVTGGSFSFSTSGNDVLLNYTAVPEPAAWILAAFGLTTAMVFRRRRD